MLFSNFTRGSVRTLLVSHTKFSRCVRLLSNRYGKVFAEKLKNKCLIEVKGKDAPSFLQGLITNDIGHLEAESKSIYSMFLNNKGRVMFDTIVFKGSEDETFYLECDVSSVSILEKHLKKYKLRKKLTLNVLKDDFSIYSVYSLNEVINALPEGLVSVIDSDCFINDLLEQHETLGSLNDVKFNGVISFRDPRLSALGYRVVIPKGSELKDPNLNILDNIELYRLCRYWLGIAEGIDEIPFEQCFPLECNCDYLHGVSFHKGCYIGQELTARSHHTGVIRKRLMPILFENDPPGSLPSDIKTDMSDSAKKVGKLRSHLARYGIALLRTNECIKLPCVCIGDLTAHCFKPSWWPQESSKLVKQEIS